MTQTLLLLAVVGMLFGCAASPKAQRAGVIEVVTFQLKPGVTAEEFRPLDRAVELQHVAKQPGFVSRESAAGEHSQWLVIVHWRSAKDADASMASFSSAPATADFMAKIQPNTMTMMRYRKE